MKNTLRAIATLGLCAAIGLPAAAQNLVQNGSFELGTVAGTFQTIPGSGASITGWSVTNGTVDYINTYWQAADGVRSVDLSGTGNGTIEQSIAVAGPWNLYELTFAIAANPDGPPVLKTLEVLWDGVVVDSTTFDKTGKTRTNMGWVYYTATIGSTAGTHSLGFRSGTGTAYGPALDDVSLVAVPEAGSLAMLLPGLLPLAAIARRRARKA